MPVPLLIDTDIGDDIDDAFAIALAVRSPEVELIGVTTVYQCAALRARLAAHLLAAYGRDDVPVVAGTDRPLLGSVDRSWRPNQAGVLEGAPAARVAEGRAVDFIIREGLRRDGLVLLPVGAMTNVALAFAAEPRLAGRVRVVAMGGAWDREAPEYNVRCDPEAVAAVLASGARPEFVGLDVTTRVRLSDPDLCRLAASPEASAERSLLAFLRCWQRGGGRPDSACPLLHDPLALAAILRPDLLSWREGAVSVELADPGRRGRTRLDDGANARVAVTVDAEAAAEFIGGRLRS